MISLSVTPTPTSVPDVGSSIGIGTWPEWVAAVLTGLAFLVAAVSFALEVGRRRKAQARLVYAEIRHIQYVAPGETYAGLAHGARWGGPLRLGPGGDVPLQKKDDDGHALFRSGSAQVIYTVAVCNGSDEMLSASVVRWHRGGERIDTLSAAGSVTPHGERLTEYQLPNSAYPHQAAHRMDLLFRDSGGRWWRRDGAEPVERIHRDPRSIPGRPSGSLPKKVGLRVKAGRAWRRMRGKPAIP